MCSPSRRLLAQQGQGWLNWVLSRSQGVPRKSLRQGCDTTPSLGTSGAALGSAVATLVSRTAATARHVIEAKSRSEVSFSPPIATIACKEA